MSRKVALLLQLGCGHLVALLLVTSVLLVVDTFAVSLGYQAWREYRGATADNPRIVQAVLIIGPLVLLFLQYWLYDRVRDFVFRPRVDARP
jgi:hypothetical protein